MSADTTFAIITGGGTGGHVVPALAIAEALVARGHDRASIHYVGSERGIETELVPPTGFPLTLLPGRGIQRRLTFENVGAVAGLLVALVRAFVLLRRLRPAVVVAVGGYASVAVSLAAVVRRVPVVVAEQNVVPGAANRLLARFARAAAVSFPGTPLQRAVVTGNPVRASIASIDRTADRRAARLAFGVDPDRTCVLVWGGSLGALRINQAMLDALPSWRHRDDLTVHHVVGARDWSLVESTDVDGGAVHYRRVQYEHDMPAALAAADLAVCRSGSGTCFELLAAGLPAVLVPSPFVTADQQTANARVLEELGAAVVVPDAELDGARLVAVVDELLSSPEQLDKMSATAKANARPDAADAIASLVEDHARGR